MANSARVLLIALALIMGASAVQAQSPFDVLDREWERFQKHNQGAYKLDDTPPKSWAWHGINTAIGGAIIGALTPLSTRQGRHVVAALYVARELYNVAFAKQKNRNYLDATMDAVTPVVVARIRF